MSFIEYMDKYHNQIFKIVNPIIAIIVGVIIYEIISKIVEKSANKNFKNAHQEKRVKTISRHILNIIKYIIIIIIAIAILANFGVNVTSILAGLGITAALIGLAFQDLAKDLIAGISIILEDQYEIGDTVEINGFLGEVVSLGLRTTRLKNYKGQTMIIANHSITEVINYNLAKNFACIDISVAYEEDLDKVEESINELSDILKEKYSKINKDIVILGVNELDSSSIVYRLGIETTTSDYFYVQRVLRKEIKKKFDKDKIKIPYQQIEVHNGK